MKEFLRREITFGCLFAPFAIPVGIPISWLAIALFTWSTEAATGFFLISIVCTAGISLILWVPVWYVAGFVTLTGLRWLLSLVGVQLGWLPTRKERAARRRAEEVERLTPEEQALLKYIKQAQAKGLEEGRIRETLLANGWSREHVNRGFRLVAA